MATRRTDTKEKALADSTTTTVQVNRNVLHEAVDTYTASKLGSDYDFLRPLSQRDIVHIALKQLTERIKKETGITEKNPS
jgi:hypothetical protein